MNKKLILTVVLVAVVIVGSWYFIFKKPAIAPGPEIDEKERACFDSGGTLTTAICCQSTSDFPNTCLIGACGCAPEYSHKVKVCECPNGCWDGTRCVKNRINTEDWKTYTNSRYAYTMKYPPDWRVKHEFGSNQILGRGYYELNRFDSPRGYALLFAVVPENSDVVPIPRTGIGAGDIVNSDEKVMIGNMEVGMKSLVFEGKIKELLINDFKINGYEGRAYISYFGKEDYNDFDMSGAGEVEIIKAILESFELAHSSRIEGFCGTSTNGQCYGDSDCMSGGCSGQVCQSKSEEPVITACEYRDCYDANKYGVACKCIENKCRWR